MGILISKKDWLYNKSIRRKNDNKNDYNDKTK